VAQGLLPALRKEQVGQQDRDRRADHDQLGEDAVEPLDQRGLVEGDRRQRRLLPELPLCAWKALSSFLREDTGGNALPAAIVSIQTAGEFLNWHPHLHVLAPAGAFRADCGFVHSPLFDPAVLRDLFQANVLAILLKERMISSELVERMKDWRHSGFHAYAGEEIPDIGDALRVGLYMVRRPDSPWLAARRKSWARFVARRMCGFRVDSHPLVGILTAKGRRKRRWAVWRVGKVDPAPKTPRPDRFPGPPPVSRPSPGKRKCLFQPPCHSSSA
jgi:hypothetical protein